MQSDCGGIFHSARFLTLPNVKGGKIPGYPTQEPDQVPGLGRVPKNLGPPTFLVLLIKYLLTKHCKGQPSLNPKTNREVNISPAYPKFLSENE